MSFIRIALGATALTFAVPAFAADDAAAANPPVEADANAPAPEDIGPATLDTNGDGKADAWDKDGNGTPDAWDQDGDGKPDAWDKDGDGKPDAPTR